MKPRLLAAALFCALTAATAAPAATFSLAGGTAYPLPGNFDPAPGTPDLGPGTQVWRNALLSLDGPGKVTFSYVGTEADWHNRFLVDGTSYFDNKAGSNPAFTLDLGPGALSLAFSTASPAGSYANGQTSGYYGSIAFFQQSPNLVYALLNDSSTSDKDFDDMVVRMEVAPVPLPAAAWLLVGAVGSLGALARRRRT